MADEQEPNPEQNAEQPGEEAQDETAESKPAPISREQLKKVLEEHKKWLGSEDYKKWVEASEEDYKKWAEASLEDNSQYEQGRADLRNSDLLRSACGDHRGFRTAGGLGGSSSQACQGSAGR